MMLLYALKQNRCFEACLYQKLCKCPDTKHASINQQVSVHPHLNKMSLHVTGVLKGCDVSSKSSGSVGGDGVLLLMAYVWMLRVLCMLINKYGFCIPVKRLLLCESRQCLCFSFNQAVQ